MLSQKITTHTHTHTYIYIHKYVCVCVCRYYFDPAHLIRSFNLLYVSNKIKRNKNIGHEC